MIYFLKCVMVGILIVFLLTVLCFMISMLDAKFGDGFCMSTVLVIAMLFILGHIFIFLSNL